VIVRHQSSRSLTTLAAARVQATLPSGPATGAVRSHRSVASLRVIRQELFRDALVRERKRAERFEDALVVVLISFEDSDSHQSRWIDVVEALSESAIEADMIGWFDDASVLGLVRRLADGEPPEAAARLAAAVQVELLRWLALEDVDRCSICVELYAPHCDSIPPVLLDADIQRPKPQWMARAAAKRALDIVGSAAFLIAFSPLFLCVSALAKLTSKGPVLFLQQRVGEGGQPFMMFKFRTMHVNADHKIHEQYVQSFIQPGEMSASDDSVVFKIVDDPRVTPVGRFLRRLSLDELPQFWNVLKGQMSLVGPRPPLPYEVARYRRWHRRRVLEAKPGITGLWQVTGRSRTTFDEMVRLDLRYARSYSVWTDLKILLATPLAVITGKGAF